jgi:hypothetical protein
MASVIAFAQRAPKQDEVEMEMMTYPEIYSAIPNRGKTTVLMYNGGTEQRGSSSSLRRLRQSSAPGRILRLQARIPLPIAATPAQWPSTPDA